MMISQISLDDQIAETEWLIEYVVQTVLNTIPDRENIFSVLRDLRYFEDDLQRLQELKKNDRNH